jgi:hypothetical protein
VDMHVWSVMVVSGGRSQVGQWSVQNHQCLCLCQSLCLRYLFYTITLESSDNRVLPTAPSTAWPRCCGAINCVPDALPLSERPIQIHQGIAEWWLHRWTPDVTSVRQIATGAQLVIGPAMHALPGAS